VLGGAANKATNLRALGCKVYFPVVVRSDAVEHYVQDLLRRQDISHATLPEDPSHPVTDKMCLVAQQQYVLRLDQESGTAGA
jgi:bifunctional ADP-heptose synthase (sugar kinase/adenylyltransferase)